MALSQTEASEMDQQPFSLLAGDSLPFAFMALHTPEPAPPPGLPEARRDAVAPKMTFGEACEECLVHPSQTECTICISDLCSHEIVRTLPCQHAYHASCIDQWFARSTLCPNCKTDVSDAKHAELL